MRHLALIQPRVGIGDMIWHLPHIRALARHVAGRVTLVTRRRSMADQFMDVADGIDAIFWVERGQWDQGGRHEGAAGMLRLVRDLRALDCDGAVLMTRSRNLTLAVLGMGVRHRHGYGIGWQHRVLRPPFLAPALWRAHPYDQATAWMEAAGIPLDRPDPVLHVTPLQREAAAARLDVTGAVALGIAASDDWKNWGSERFAALARSLDRPIVLVGGPAEQGIADAILAATPSGKIRSALGWPLRELAAMLAGCSLYIGNDTAALNMAAAVGVRSIGLFGGTAPLRHSPLIIPILPPGGIDRETGMSRITVDAVLAQIPQLPV